MQAPGFFHFAHRLLELEIDFYFLMQGLNLISKDVFQYINFHLQFREEKLAKEFLYYNQYQKSVMIMGTATIVFAFIFSPFESFALYYGQTYLEICYACVQVILSLVITAEITAIST